MTALARATPARRARARRDPAVLLPPTPPVVERDLANLHLRVDGVPYKIGGSITGQPVLELTMDGASSLQLDVDDRNGRLLEALVDEALMMRDGARIILDDVVYVLASLEPSDGTVQQLTLIDEVAWRLDQFDSYKAVSTSRMTDGEFVYGIVRDASRRPLADMAAFIPEIRERLPKAPAAKSSGTRGSASTSRGFGDTTITVKGVKATAGQRRVLGEGLVEAQSLGASRRVLIAVVMAITEESVASSDPGVTGDDDTGPLQQGRPWISAANSGDVAKAVRAFLLGHLAKVGGTDPTVKGWKQHHGSLKNAQGSLTQLIHKVQRNRVASVYAKWEAEATKTVDAFLGANPTSSGGVEPRTEPAQYTRGSRGDTSETWWGTATRMAEERRKRAWAAYNTLHYVSERELRAAATSIIINGDEPWLLTQPMWKIAKRQPITELEFTVQSARWGVQPGAVITMANQGALNGRYLLSVARDELDTPRTTVTLKRPTPPGFEPAGDSSSTSGSGDGEGDGTLVGKIEGAADALEAERIPYSYGGGHVTPAKPTAGRSGVGLDCSSSISYVLQHAGIDVATMTSGGFMKWGQAGPGKHVTLYAHEGHILMAVRVDGEWRFFGTSRSNPGGGPGWIPKPSDAYLARFTKRHPAGL